MAQHDEPTSVRPGEELDVDRLRAYLADTVGLRGEVTVRQFPSGFSNLTYLVTVGEEELILRRPPFGKKPKTGHDMAREYRVLRALKPVFRYCPAPLAFCDDLSVLGCPFYVMERIRGLIIRRSLPAGMTLTPAQARALSERLIEVLCELHSVDYRAAGLGEFGKPEGYVKRQVEGWIERYRDARTPDAAGFEDVMAWLTEKMPPDADVPAVIHNDYKFDNVVLNPDNPIEIIGVLDWEMATVGDPLMDLGNSIAYWVEKGDPDEVQAIRTMATNIDGMLTRRELVARYGEITGRNVEGFEYYYVFGLFRLAVIAQQIYYRFFHGQTADERFRMLVFAVRILEKAAREVTARSGL